MSDRRRFVLAFILGLAASVLLLAAGELFFRFSKNDLHEAKKTFSVVQVVLGKSIQQNSSSPQSSAQKKIAADDENIFPLHQNIDEVIAPNNDSENSLNDMNENIFFESITSSEKMIGDNNAISSASSSIEAEKNKLSEIIYALIEKEKQYPALARRRNIEGQVDVTIKVSAAGELEESVVSSSSGTSILDQAATNVIQNIFPLNIILQSETEMIITIRYSLR
jgi:TonB family protein